MKDARNWGKPSEGKTLYFEAHNKDDLGIIISPGQRLRIRAKDGQSIVLDRAQLVTALAFLETQKPEDERETWCATCGQRAELESA